MNQKISDRIEALETRKRKRPLTPSCDTAIKKKRAASTKADVKTAQMMADDNENEDDDEIIEETESEHG